MISTLSVPYVLSALIGCGSADPDWAVHHLSVTPDRDGISGTQTWEFFSKKWAKNRSEKSHICSRAQLVAGEESEELEGCLGCEAAYVLIVEDLETDCEDSVGTDPGFDSSLPIAFGNVPEEFSDLDPWPGRSLGWYLSEDGATYQPWGFAYVEGLDYEGDRGLPGWIDGQTYTLWPAVALDL